MIQKNFLFHELAEALKHVESLALLKKHSHCHDALLTIFVSGLTATEGQILINALNNELNDVKRIGLSVYNLEGKEDVIIDFNLLLSQEANFTTFEIPCEAGAELQAAEELKRTLASLENVQGIQLFPVNPTLHVTHFLEAISLGQEEIPIFGTMAMVSNLSDSSFELPVDCFGLGQSIMRCGFCGVVYSGSDLQIYMDYILGWKPIGREMPITLAESKGMGESILATIDGAPAFDIYKRYLGIDWSEDIIENVWAFPLMIRRKNVNLCYVPMFSDKKILRCAGSIFPGETIRFSYCTREEILDASSRQ